jgi:hypothetical protein
MNPTTGFPSYFRPTFAQIPANKEVLQSIGCPFAFVIAPGLIADIPLFDHSSTDLIRCTQCFAYLSPYVEVQPSDSGFKCALCGHLNPSNTQFSSLQVLPEMQSPFYDAIPPANYLVKPYICASFCFLIDISERSVRKGFARQFASSILSILSTLDDSIRFSIVTVSHKIVCYDLANGRCVIPADLDDVVVSRIVPAPLSRGRESLTKVLNSIIALDDGDGPGTALTVGFLAADQVLAATGGLLIVGAVDFPPLQGEELKAAASSVLWQQIRARLSSHAISCHAFFASRDPGPMDFPPLPITCSLLGGSFYEYGDFSGDAHARLHADLYRTLTAEYLYDCTTRVRCSEGVRVVRLLGNFSTKRDLVVYPVLRADRTIILELDIPKPITAPHITAQLGMIFTTARGERRVRVLTFQIQVAASAQAAVSCADPVALAAVIVRRGMTAAPHPGNPLDRLLSLFAAQGGTQIPAFFRLVHAFVTSPIATAAVADLAWRATATALLDCPLAALALWLCPRMIAIDRGAAVVPCSAQSFPLASVFLFHAWDRVILWAADGADARWVDTALGPPGDTLERLGTLENDAVWGVVEECQKLSGRYLPVLVLRQGDPRELAIAALFRERAQFAEWYAGTVGVTLS